MRKVVESVTAGHPDKVCDQIADAIVDEYLRRDKESSVDLNVFGSHGMLMIGGEVSSKADFDMAALAKKVYQGIGYDDEIEVFVNVEPQSDEMLKAKKGTYNTVVVNGYATRETREFLPRSFVFANQIVRRLDDLRQSDRTFSWLRPDGKVQIVMDKQDVKAITVLASHSKDIETKEVQNAILDRIIAPIVGDHGIQMFINPIGPFTVDGFNADSGASGRKLSSDTYGGLIPHGDSSLSGKDPMRVERAGAYMARFAAKYLVENDLVENAFINVAYTMGQSEPVHLEVSAMQKKSKGTKVDFTNLIKEKFDFRPEAIVERFGLTTPLYQQTATYGHFGRFGFPWEESVKD